MDIGLLPELVEATDGIQIVEHLANRINAVVVRLPAPRQGAFSISELIKRFGHLIEIHGEAIADNKITPKEYEDLHKCGLALIADTYAYLMDIVTSTESNETINNEATPEVEAER